MGVWREIRRSVPASIRKPVRKVLGRLKGEQMIVARPAGPQIDGLLELTKVVGAHLGRSFTMVEIGSYQGESTEIFAQQFGQSKILAVDPFLNDYDDGDGYSYLFPMSEIEKRFDERTKPYANITKVKKMSLDFAREVKDQSLDFVYIDACHEYDAVKQDIQAWLPKVKPGGMIAGHDYLTWAEVRRAVEEMIGMPDHVFQDSSWAKAVVKQKSNKKLNCDA